jgi:lysophospholipase
MKTATLYADKINASSAASSYWFQARDGVKLRIAAWKPEASGKGTVLIFPGRTDYIEKLSHVAIGLATRGYSSLVIDWRGQGLSDRLTQNRLVSHVVRFSDYQADVAAMVEAAEQLDMPKPWYLLGYSMGATIGLRSLLDGLKVDACAFTGPLWDIKLSALERPVAWLLTGFSQAFGKGHAFAPGNIPQRSQCYVLSVGFDGNRLTSDPTMFERLVSQARALPELQTGAPSMGWVFEALKECSALRGLPSPSIPCVAFCGEQDTVVDLSAIKDRMRRWTNGKLEMVSDAKHDLLSETSEIQAKLLDEMDNLFSRA